MTAIEGQPTYKLQWLTEEPVWVDQWPLTREKLSHIPQLVAEQEQAGHIRPSTSPWNTAIFTIPIKSGQWRLLHDLRAINAVMKDMGALQPGLPSPVMIPENWELIIIDLKDCFFTIPLHPDDCEKFAFSVPAINKNAPAKRYEWVVLPQGMKNSPTICQLYVAWALQPLRERFQEYLIYHYMDDILIAAKKLNREQVISVFQRELAAAGLTIAPKKIQMHSPWKYLGWIITGTKICPQKITVTDKMHTLADVQKLIGDIQWVQPLCGITNDDLSPLMSLLKGTPDVGDRRQLSAVQQAALQHIINKIATAFASQWNPDLPLQIFIVNAKYQPFALLIQWNIHKADPLCILEWIFLPYLLSKTISTRIEAIAQVLIEARKQSCEIVGIDPEIIRVPIIQEMFDWVLQSSLHVQLALADFHGKITTEFPSHKLVKMLMQHNFEGKSFCSPVPLSGLTVFTDASRNKHRTGYVWHDGNQWNSKLIPGDLQDSLQTLELTAVVDVFKKWALSPLNIVCDSLYVVGIVQRLERSIVREVANSRLKHLLGELLFLLQNRKHEYFIMHFGVIQVYLASYWKGMRELACW